MFLFLGLLLSLCGVTNSSTIAKSARAAFESHAAQKYSVSIVLHKSICESKHVNFGDRAVRSTCLFNFLVLGKHAKFMSFYDQMSTLEVQALSMLELWFLQVSIGLSAWEGDNISFELYDRFARAVPETQRTKSLRRIVAILPEEVSENALVKVTTSAVEPLEDRFARFVEDAAQHMKATVRNLTSRLDWDDSVAHQLAQMTVRLAYGLPYVTGEEADGLDLVIIAMESLTQAISNNADLLDAEMQGYIESINKYFREKRPEFMSD